jgi:hypothetical protein
MSFQSRIEGKDMSKSAIEIDHVSDRTRSRSRESQDGGRLGDVPLNRGRSRSRTGDVSRSRSRGAKSESTIPASPDVGAVQEAEQAAAR